jgi:fumarate hydratase class I
MNAQYSLPQELPNLGRADRSIEGVRKCILHAVWNARARAAHPARSVSASAAIARRATCTPKNSSFARSDDVNPDPRLASSKRRSWVRSTSSAVGTMGFGGRVSLIGCKVGALNRLPASFFVSGRLRLLGLPPPRCRARREER